MKLFGLLITIVLGLWTSAFGLDWVSFTVTHHINTSSYTATDVDDALDDVNDRLKYDNHDCSDDTPCTVRFFRSGTLGTFGTSTDGLDVITNQTELNSVFGINTHRVKVVDSVDYCAGGYNTSIIGCGRCDAFGYIVEDWVGGAVYVHEFGHNVLGCGHRDTCSNNIMHSISIGTNNSVNSTECSGFGGKAYTQLCGTVYDGNGGPLTAGSGPYWLNCSVTVPEGRVLTIHDGVEIQFHMGRQLVSYGVTNADGSTATITIYSNNEDQNFPTAAIDGEMVIQSGGALILD